MNSTLPAPSQPANGSPIEPHLSPSSHMNSTLPAPPQPATGRPTEPQPISQQLPAAPNAHAQKQDSLENVTLIGYSMSNDIIINRMKHDKFGEKIKCSTLVDAITCV